MEPGGQCSPWCRVGAAGEAGGSKSDQGPWEHTAISGDMGQTLRGDFTGRWDGRSWVSACCNLGGAGSLEDRHLGAGTRKQVPTEKLAYGGRIWN